MEREEVDKESKELIRVYVTGKPAEKDRAFGRLYEINTPPLLGYVASYLETTDENRLDEVCQAVWVEVVKMAPTYDPTLARFTTWLIAIARHLCFNDGRDRQRRKKRFCPVDEQLDVAKRETRPEVEDLDTAGFRQAIDEALAALPPEQAEAWRLKHEKGMSESEISRLTGEPRETVRNRVRYANEKLRPIFGRFG